MTKMELKNKVKDYDTRKWEEEIASRSTLKYYREGKTGIGYDKCYRNNVNSMFLARARVNSLGLEEVKGRGVPGYNKICKLCGLEVEDILHFTMTCPILEKTRSRHKVINKNIKDSRERMVELLFRQNEHQKVGNLLRSLWNKRKQIMDYNEKEKLRQNNVKKMIQRSDPGPERNIYTPIRIRSNSISEATRG